MADDRRILLISGSLRRRSTNRAVLTAFAGLSDDDARADLYDGMAGLPHFNPDHDVDPLPAAVQDLRDAVHASAAVVLCVPEYAGGLPGSCKNLLDWLIGDDQAGSINDKPVCWINASPRGAAGAHASLRAVLGYAGAAVIAKACLEVPVTSAMVDDHGVLGEPSVIARIRVARQHLMAALDDRRG